MGSCCGHSYAARLSEPLLDGNGKNAGYKSGKPADVSISKVNNRLNKQLQREQARDRIIKKLLLLGPGNSGKSTFFKQVRSECINQSLNSGIYGQSSVSE